MKTKYLWKSDFALLIQAHIREMKISGFRFEVQQVLLRHFDEFCFNQRYFGVDLTKGIVEEFCYGTYYEKQSTRYRKELVIRNLGLFIKKQGLDAYIIKVKSAPKKRSSFKPYIYTEKELADIFLAIDNQLPNNMTNRDIVDPLLFRLLYGTGLRLSEVLNLQLKDINFENETIIILHAKNNKDRMIPIAKSLIIRCEKYTEKVHKFSTDDTIFFKNLKGNRFDLSTIYRHFRDYLWLANIPHTGRGPRIHDLRHTYSVHCLKNWILAGKELTSLMPYLSTYLGHSDFRGTQYYLHLTSELYPDIIQKNETAYDYIIPDLGDFND